jgi:hypothetical protein
MAFDEHAIGGADELVAAVRAPKDAVADGADVQAMGDHGLSSSGIDLGVDWVMTSSPRVNEDTTYIFQHDRVVRDFGDANE